MKKIPILLITFNRPKETMKVFLSIKEYKPEKIFIASDGPRENNLLDQKLCQETRNIIKEIDWPCEVKTLFRQKNLGVDVAAPEAIDWFFSFVDKGIILEDDCCPNIDYYKFVEELITRYESNEKIMMISGDNFQEKNKKDSSSYYFSIYPNTWGWATWKRAWLKYKNDLNKIKNINKIIEIFPTKTEKKYWLNFFKKINKGKYTFWDAKWAFSIWENNGLSITPGVNLISNIGFGENATHTKDPKNSMFISTEFINWPLSHPKTIQPDSERDRYLFKKIYYVNFFKKVFLKLKKIIT